MADVPSVSTEQRDDPRTGGDGTDDLVQADLLVEDVSIDGMCGVY